MASSKNIVAELNKGEKLNCDNYNIWHRKVQHVLEEQETLETLHNTIKFDSFRKRLEKSVR